jgi:hypothetical protein
MTTAPDYGSVLEAIALRDGDLADGYTKTLMDGGDQVDGQVTLDNCGFDFTTEAHRVARRQYLVVDSSATPSGLSDELAAYDSPAQAPKAVAQWLASAATCVHPADPRSLPGRRLSQDHPPLPHGTSTTR